MSLPLISVVIPTIGGREDHYQRCAAAYRERTSAPLEIITETGHPACGLAWQAGASRAQGDYIHLTCDDLEPLPGWDTAAVQTADAGFLPAPRVADARTGQLQSRPAWGQEFADGTDTGVTVIPFLTREQWTAVQPLFTGHYYTDDFISDRARSAGWPPAMCNGYSFLHHWAQHKRGAGMTETDRMYYDEGRYHQALAMVAAGNWDRPWPEPE